MRVLITGGTGFIGGHYLGHLRQHHPELRLFFSGRDLQKGHQLAAATGAHFYRGDLEDIAYCNLICKDVDVVVHCAGKSGIWGDYEAYYRANVIPTEQLLAAALKNGVGRLVNLGSPSVYFDFNDHLNITEDYLPPRFADNYARSKYQAETRGQRAHCEQLRTLSLRPRFVVGPGDRTTLPRVIASHQRGQLVQIGEGRNIVSMTSIDNLMQALDCAVLGPDEVCGDLYNIADPDPVNLWDTINELLRLLAMPPMQHKLPYGIAYGLAAVTEAGMRVLRRRHEPVLTRHQVAIMGNSFTLNTDRAQRRLGYQPAYIFEQTLKGFVEWWREDAQCHYNALR